MRENIDMAHQATLRINASIGLDLERLIPIRLFPLQWWKEVQRARVAYGAHCTTAHIREGEWLEHWRAGMDPASAVQTELQQIAD